LAEEVAVESAPGVVCGEFSGPVRFNTSRGAGCVDIATFWVPP
jgi:hypothetical protein